MKKRKELADANAEILRLKAALQDKDKEIDSLKDLLSGACEEIENYQKDM